MRKLRYFIEYLLVKFWLFLINLLGIKNARKLSIKIFTFIGTKFKASNTAVKNLAMVFPEFSPQKINQIVLGVWSNLALVASETPFLMNMPQKEFDKHITIKGLDNLEKIRGKRALIATAHLANWEIIGKILYGHDFIVCGVYRAANNKLVDKIIYDMRNKIEVTMIPKGKSGAKQIISALQKDQQVVMLVDQKMNDGIKVPFLGHDAMTAPAIATLALKYDCPIIPIQIIRKKDSNFEVIIHSEIEHKNKTSEAIMNEINQVIGKWVKQHPAQWFWLHKRWIKN